jgi:putative copper export protein
VTIQRPATVPERSVAGAPNQLGMTVALGVLLATSVGAGIVIGLGGDELIGLGLPDPGLLTRAGLPVMRVLSDCAAVVTVGALLFAAFLVPPQACGSLDTSGHAAIRTARITALSWTLTAALMVPLSAADEAARPVTDLLDPELLASLVFRLTQPGTWALTALITLVLTGLVWTTRRWGAAVWLFALSLLGLTPLALSGHSSVGGAHDIALASLLYHLLAAALWVGGLIALLAHLARRGDHAGLACARFSRLALVCWIVMASSGVINALVRVSLDRLLTTYGLLALGKTAPPSGLTTRPTPTEVLLGYDLAGPAHPGAAAPELASRTWCSGSRRWCSPAPTVPGCDGYNGAARSGR